MASLQDIIYTREGELCSVSADAEAPSACIESGNAYESPAWSPDGTEIAVEATGPDDDSHLMLLSPYGEPLRKIDSSSGFMKPAWSADGRYLYAVNRKIGAAVGRWDKSGGNYRAIPVHGIPADRPEGPFEQIEFIAFSPDGSSMAILAEGFYKLMIAEEKNGSFEVTRWIPENGIASLGMPVWIDNSRILITGLRDSRRAELLELNVIDGSVKVREISGLLIRGAPALSPDRRSIVICGVAEENKTVIRWNLWRHTFASSALHKLTDGSEDLQPSWRGAGRSPG